MEKKSNNIKLIILIILFLIINCFIIFKYLINNNNKTNDDNNVTIINSVDGAFSGYQLTLTASHGGTGIAGQDLGSGTTIKKFNISKNDEFIEPIFGGVWKLNYNNKEDEEIKGKKIFKIIELGEESVKVQMEGKDTIINYDEEKDVPSRIFVYDGVNYSYKIKIIKVAK